MGPLADWVVQTVGGFTGMVLLLVCFPFTITVDQRGGCHLVFHESSWTSCAAPLLPSLLLCHNIAYLSCNITYFLTSHHSSLSHSITYLLISHHFSLSFPPSRSPPYLNHLRSLLIWWLQQLICVGVVAADFFQGDSQITFNFHIIPIAPQLRITLDQPILAQSMRTNLVPLLLWLTLKWMMTQKPLYHWNSQYWSWHKHVQLWRWQWSGQQ